MSRSLWKNNFVSTQLWHWMLFRKIHALKKNYFAFQISERSVSNRACTILPIMEGKTFWIHNGLKYRPVLVKSFMYGNRFGDYVHTKTRCIYKRKKKSKQRNKKK